MNEARQLRLDTWILRYRGSQLLTNLLNEAIGHIFLHIHMFFILGLTTIAIFLLIKMKVGIVITILLFIYNVIMGCTISTWGKLTKFEELSTKALQSRKYDRDKTCENLKVKVLRSCRPMIVKVGSFLKLNKKVCLASYAVVIEYTILLLITVT